MVQRKRTRPTFPLLAKGQRPSAASNEELRRHGLPPRPDPRKFPGAARLWLTAEKRFRFQVEPILITHPGRVHGYVRDLRKTKTEGTGYTSGNWSGKVFATGGRPYAEAWASWTVPRVQIPPGGGPGIYYSSIWLGFGGFNPTPLLQAGTEQDITLDAAGNITANTYAWTEWFTDVAMQPEQEISQQVFPVSPGDSVALFLYWAGGSNGSATFLNLDTGLSTAVQMTKPNDGTVMVGDTVEWIVERPSLIENGAIVPQPLADYGIVNISSAQVKTGYDTVTNQAELGSAETANSINMEGANNQIISEENDEPNVHCIFGSDLNTSVTS